MTFRDFIRSLFGLPPLDHAAPTQTIDDGGDYYLGTPKPGALVEEIGANFPNPFGMPIGFLFDLANTPDYSTVINGGNRRSILDILNGLFPGITPSGNSGNPVLDFLNGFTPPIPGVVLTPEQIFAQDAANAAGLLALARKRGEIPEDWGVGGRGVYRPDLYPEWPSLPQQPVEPPITPPVITNPGWDGPTISPVSPNRPGGTFVV